MSIIGRTNSKFILPLYTIKWQVFNLLVMVYPFTKIPGENQHNDWKKGKQDEQQKGVNLNDIYIYIK